MRGSCYSVATEPQHWSSINGRSQKVVARWLEEKKRDGSQVGRAQGPGAEVVAKISFPRNEEVRAQGRFARSRPEEERVEINGSQVFSEEIIGEEVFGEKIFPQNQRA